MAEGGEVEMEPSSGVPPEYCEFLPKGEFKRALPWLVKNRDTGAACTPPTPPPSLPLPSPRRPKSPLPRPPSPSFLPRGLPFCGEAASCAPRPPPTCSRSMGPASRDPTRLS